MLRRGHGGLNKVPRRKKAKNEVEREIRSSLLILDLKENKLAYISDADRHVTGGLKRQYTHPFYAYRGGHLLVD